MAIDLSALSSLGSLASQQSPIDRLVSQYMAVENKPLQRIQAERTTVSSMTSVYNDLSSRLQALNTMVTELSKSDGTSPFQQLSATPSDATALSATATSAAAVATHTISIASRAAAQRVASTQVAASWQSGTGSFVLNGATIDVAAASSLSALAAAINGASYASGRGVVATVVDNTLVLASQTTGAANTLSLYDPSNVLAGLGLQSGAAVALPPASTSQTGNATVVDLGSARSVSRVEWGPVVSGLPKDYTIDVSTDGTSWTTVKTVMGNGDGGTSPVDLSFASTQARYVRLNATSTGDGAASGVTGFGVYDDGGTFARQLTAAGDASFTVDGINVTRSTNTGIADVIDGVTLNLTADSASNVSLAVGPNTTNMQMKVQAFLDKLNDLLSYIKAKGAVVKGNDGNYSRGPLAGDSTYIRLRNDLMRDVGAPVAGITAGQPQSLADVGVAFDTTLTATISDTSKLTATLGSNPSAVMNLFAGPNGVAQQILTRISPFVTPPAGSTKDVIDFQLEGITNRVSELDRRASDVKARLALREQLLRAQFTRMQALLIDASNQQDAVNKIFSAANQMA